MLVTRNFYIVKQIDGTLWNFTYKDNFGIIYRIYQKKSWSTYNILVKNASKEFSATILPDNKICIIYGTSSGNLLLKVYSEGEWKEYSILQKKGNGAKDIHFKTIFDSEEIQIFYSILQSKDNIRALFHQTLILNEDLKVSSPVLIDTTNVNTANQFVIHVLQDHTICIMYQKLLNKYELGYKNFDTNSKNWSEFHSIDKNVSPYIDYSLGSVQDKLNIMYIKKNEAFNNALYNFRGNIANHQQTKIAESKDLVSCALFRERDITYSFWISNNYIYNYYTNDMDTNISPIKSEGLKSMNIIKSSFSEVADQGRCISNELYVQDETELKILPNNFFAYKENLKVEQNKLKISSRNFEVNSHLSMNHVQESSSMRTEENVVSIENRLIKKDQLINQLNYIIKEEKNKVMILNNKISLLENDYIQWENQKSRLYSDTNSLQEALILKESRIHELEKSMLEEEIKLIELKKINLNSEEQNEKNLKMEPEIEGYKISIINSNKTIEELNSKISLLEGEKDVLINDKTNSSLFKKLFNS